MDKTVTPTQSSGREVWQSWSHRSSQWLVSQGHSPACRGPHLPSRPCPSVSLPEVHLGPRSLILSLSPKEVALGCLFLPRMPPSPQGPQNLFHTCPSPGPRSPPWIFFLPPRTKQITVRVISCHIHCKNKDTNLRLCPFLKSNEIGVQVTKHSVHIKNVTTKMIQN